MRFSDLAEILRRELGPDLGAKACQIMCRMASGETVYIPSRDVCPEILPTDTPQRVIERYGVTKRTAYNWVNRWRG